MVCAHGILGGSHSRILILHPHRKILSCHGSLSLGDLTGHSPEDDDTARTMRLGLFLDDMYTVAFRVSFAFLEGYVWVNRLLSVGVSI